MKVLTIMWSSYLPLLREAADGLGIELSGYSTKQINRKPEMIGEIEAELDKVDLVLLYRTHDPFWEEMEETLHQVRDRTPLIVVGSDPSFGAFSSVSPEIVVNVYRYILFGGPKNITHMFKYLLRTIFEQEVAFEDPDELPWQGICHPGMGKTFQSSEEFLSAYRKYLPIAPVSYVGVLYSRSNWASGNLEVETSLVSALEKQGLGVIPVFLYSLKDANLGNLSGVEVVERFFVRQGFCLVDAIVKLTAFFLGSAGGGIQETDVPSGVELLKRLDVPLFSPVISYYKDRDQWLSNCEGLGSQVGWSIAMPEFEGVIEPIMVGAIRGITDPREESYDAIGDRIDRLADRVARWISLRKKPNPEKKVA
ncbi:MAG TPA: cobaltochelatase subunit CobN, partial [Thermodesulfobacteriota bacterium]|nr:cobaltochelatase subunit CobN [Thermodesulfobacteriota bacterium]